MKHCEKWSDMVSFVKLDRHPDGETCCEKLGKWFSTFSLGKNIRNCGRIPTNWKHAKKKCLEISPEVRSKREEWENDDVI
jgi:hypothetical protein